MSGTEKGAEFTKTGGSGVRFRARLRQGVAASVLAFDPPQGEHNLPDNQLVLVAEGVEHVA